MASNIAVILRCAFFKRTLMIRNCMAHMRNRVGQRNMLRKKQQKRKTEVGKNAGFHME